MAGCMTTVVSSLVILIGAGAAQAKEPPRSGYACTQVMGVSVTGDWFGNGFESGVDGAKWQAQTRKHAFVDLWADPRNEIWSEPVVSRCARGADAPDRIIFTGVNWEFKTADQWTEALTRVVEALKTRYPKVRRIELATMLRAPGNKSCGNPMTVVAPIVDEAVARVVTANGPLVTAAPRLEAPSCAVFTKGGPHFTDAGMKEVAKVYAAHYAR
jgi:hypothetical protein